jgi:hypothetical protein
MRRVRIWINRIALGLFVASVIYLIFRIVTFPAPRSAFALTAQLLLLHTGLSLGIASIVGTIAAALSFVVSYFDWSLTSPIKRSLRLSGRVLAGTFLGLIAGGTIGFVLGYAFAPTLDQIYPSTENPFGAGRFIPPSWSLGTLIGGIWGLTNSLISHSQRQRREG